MLLDHKDIVNYIINNYNDAGKIIEAGIGREGSLFQELEDRLPETLLLAIDKNKGEDKMIIDDVMDPYMDLYEDADLIYSIRPNPEMVDPLMDIAQSVGADLLIRPFGLDSCSKPSSMRLLNHGKAVLWEWRKDLP